MKLFAVGTASLLVLLSCKPRSFNENIAATESVPTDSRTFDSQLAQHLATAYLPSSQKADCLYKASYHCVAEALTAVGVVTNEQFDSLLIDKQKGFDYTRYAKDFAVWAKRFPDRVAKTKLKMISLGSGYTLQNIPAGAVIVYNPGVCGAQLQGNIEIVVNAGKTQCGDVDQRNGVTVFLPAK